MYTRKERDKIITIRRRIQMLELRVAGNPHFSFDRAEISALRWALDQIASARGPLPEWKEPEEMCETTN
jgi:nicotinic acid mononucleotide adenylyltransferase